VFTDTGYLTFCNSQQICQNVLIADCTCT